MINWYKKAVQEDQDDILQSVDLEDYDWKSLTREVAPPDVRGTTKDSSETIYDVDGTKVRLWIITGGQPAMSFDDYSFQTRFPIKDARWAAEWDKKKEVYPHQDPSNIQGPTYDVLPEGRLTLEKFVEENLPKKILRNSRFEQIPYSQIQSRKKDQSARRFVELFTDFRSAFLPEVHGDKGMLNLFHPWWTRFLSFLQPVNDREESANAGSQGYEFFTESEFKFLLALLKEGEALGAFRVNRRNSSNTAWYKKAMDEDPLSDISLSDKDVDSLLNTVFPSPPSPPPQPSLPKNIDPAQEREAIEQIARLIINSYSEEGHAFLDEMDIAQEKVNQFEESDTPPGPFRNELKHLLDAYDTGADAMSILSTIKPGLPQSIIRRIDRAIARGRT